MLDKTVFHWLSWPQFLNFSTKDLQWNPALRPPRYYNHLVITSTFLGAAQQCQWKPSLMRSPVNTAKFFGELVTVLTEFHCISELLFSKILIRHIIV